MTKLTDQQAASLISLQQTDGWKVLVQLMDDEYFETMKEVTDKDPSDVNGIVAAQHIAKAQRMFMENIINRVEYEANEYVSRKVNEVSSEQLEQEEITGPFGKRLD